MNPWTPLPAPLAVTPRRGVAVGAICGAGASLGLAGLAQLVFGSGVLLLLSLPIAPILGAGLGWAATRSWMSRWGMWGCGVLAAFATAPATGILFGLLSSNDGFFIALMGAFYLSPAILLVGIVSGEVVWQVTRRR